MLNGMMCISNKGVRAMYSPSLTFIAHCWQFIISEDCDPCTGRKHGRGLL